MTAHVGTALVDVQVDRRALESDISKAGKEAGQKLGKGLSSDLKSAIAGAGVGLILKGALGEADEARRNAARTESVLRSTGGAANVTSKQVGDLSDRLGKLAAVDNDVVRGGENVLLTFTKVRNIGADKVFDQASEAALNMSSALGTDLQGSIIQVGKALNDPIKGVTALRRVGVSFTQAQVDQIKSLVESNNLLDAQKLILGELQTEFGGAAASMATDSQKASVALKDMEESIGGALAPAIGGAAKSTGVLAKSLHVLPPIAQQMILLGGAGAFAWARWGTSLAATGTKAVAFAKDLIVPTRAVTGLGSAGAQTTSMLNSTAASVGAVAVAGVSLIALAQSVRKAEDDASQGAHDMFDQFTGGSRFTDTKHTYADLQNELDRTKDHLGYVRNEADAAWNPLVKKGLNELAGGMQQYQGQLRHTAADARHLAHAHHISLDEALKYGTEANYATAKVSEGINRRALPTLESLRLKWKDVRTQAQGAQDDFTKAFSIGLPGDTEQAAIDTVRANQNVGATVGKNGADFDITTEKGRENREAVLGAKDSIIAYAKALMDSGVPLDQVKKKTEAMILGLDQQLIHAGATENQTKALNDELGLTPDRIAIAFATPGLDTAIAKTQKLNAETLWLLALTQRHEEQAATDRNLRNHHITNNGGDLTAHGSRSIVVHGDVHVDAKHKPASETGREIARHVVRRVAQ